MATAMPALYGSVKKNAPALFAACFTTGRSTLESAVPSCADYVERKPGRGVGREQGKTSISLSLG
jgi:hypothetical protein